MREKNERGCEVDWNEGGRGRVIVLLWAAVKTAISSPFHKKFIELAWLVTNILMGKKNNVAQIALFILMHRIFSMLDS